MEPELSINPTTEDDDDDEDDEYHDALEELPFVESNQSLRISKLDRNKDYQDGPVSILSDHTPESPSSPSSAGLRHRRRNATVSCSLKDHAKLYRKSNSSRFNDESFTVDSPKSAITSVNDDERINDGSVTVDSPDSGSNILFTVAELVIKAIGFQTSLLASSVSFPLRLMYCSYMLVTDPFGLLRSGRNYMLGNVFGIWGVVYSGVKSILQLSIKKHESTWKFCVKIGWGLLWLGYLGLVLIGLLVPALILSGIMMKLVVEEPVQMTEQLIFDYTKYNPVAFVPIVSCQEASSFEDTGKDMIGSIGESSVIPSNQELHVTVSLTLPESDYNRNLGIFQVRVDFLSGNGKPLASKRQPCMLHFKSEPIRLVSTFVKLAPLLTGYSSETQTLDIKFRGYTEQKIHTSCLRVVIEQRAEFEKGRGIPEIYSSTLKLDSRLPFLKRILWYWKGMIYVSVSITIFTFELLFTLLCCSPVVFPWLRRGGQSQS